MHALTRLALLLAPCSTVAAQSSPLTIEEVRDVPIVTIDGHQLVRVLVRNDGPTIETQARLTGGDLVFQEPVRLAERTATWLSLPIPELTEPLDCTLRLGDAASTSVTLHPPRHMEIHVLLAVHTDIGYTDLPERAAEIHCENLERMLEFCDLTEDWPEDVRPGYTIETGWQLEQFMQRCSSELVERMIERMREGRITMNALYENVLSGLCSPEAILRLRDFSDGIERKYGVRCRGASQTDTPSYSWSLCSALANTGVRYLSTALNMDRAWFEENTDIVPPFWWEAPDGQRVLTWFGFQYGPWEYGLRGTVEEAAQELPEYLERRFPADRYPWEMVLMHCYYQDNRPLTFEPLPLMREWNERYRWPHLYASTIEGFLSRFEERYGEAIPVHRGDWGTFWEDGAASSARATARNARNQSAADQATRLATLAAEVGDSTYPSEKLAKAWRGILLYDEHTWGHAKSVSDPDDPEVLEHWKFKSDCSTAPVPLIAEVRAEALEALSSLPTTGEFPAVCVWNSLSWTRSGLVRAAVEGDGDFRLVDAESGRELAWQRDGDGTTVLFVATDVPPMGFRLFELRPGASRERHGSTKIEPPVFHGEHRFVCFDDERGGIDGIIDLEAYHEDDRELVNRVSPYRLGQLIRDAGEPPENERVLVESLELDSAEAGPVVTTVAYRGSAPTCDSIEWTWSFYEELDRIDLSLAIDKRAVTEKEGLYVAFPFAIEDPKVRVETALASIVPELDQLSGTNRDWYTTVGAVSLEASDRQITWVSLDAPLVELGGITTGRRAAHLEMKRPTIVSYVMNNYWQTNYRAAQEPGRHVFEYSFTAGGRGIPDSHRFAQELQQPLLVQGLPAWRKGKYEEPARSLLSIEPDAYVLVGMRRAPDGRGVLLHLLQLAETEEEPRLAGIFAKAPIERVDALGHPLAEPVPPRLHRVVTLRVGD